MHITKIKRKKGTVYRVRLRTLGGPRLTKCFERYVDAQNWRIEMKAQVREGVLPIAFKPIQFENFVEKYLAEHCKPTMSFTGCERYQGVIRKYLLPFFRGKMLSQITRFEIDQFKNSIREKKSAVTIFRVLKTLLYKAVQWQFLKISPAQGVHTPPQSIPREDFWSKSEIARFLHAMKDNPRLPMYLLAINTGMREGEILGLQWDCVDFEVGTISIKRSFCQKQKIIRDWTKTKKDRTIPMSDPVRSLLWTLKGSSLDNLVIGPDVRSTFDVTHVSKIFAKDAKAAGVKRIRFHDLRHGYASHCTMNGVPLYTVGKLLGHSKVKTTQGYAHISQEHLDEIKNLVAFDVPKGAEIVPLGHKWATENH